MYTTKSGKKFGSSFVGKKKDSMSPENRTMDTNEPNKPMEPKEEPRTAESGMAKKTSAYPGHEVENTADTKAEPEGVDAGAVAAEHGPANSVTIHHDHKGGNHHVVSRHADGHMHKGDFGSAPDAHKAAAQLSGEQHTENDSKPANAEQLSGDDLFGNDGFKVPHLG
jgi:hypothetical protein